MPSVDIRAANRAGADHAPRHGGRSDLSPARRRRHGGPARANPARGIALAAAVAVATLGAAGSKAEDGGPYGLAPAPLIPPPVDARGAGAPSDRPDPAAYAEQVDAVLPELARDCAPWASGRTALVRYRRGPEDHDTVKLVQPVRDDAGAFTARVTYYLRDGGIVARRGPGGFTPFDAQGLPVFEGRDVPQHQRFARAGRVRLTVRHLMMAFPPAGGETPADGRWQSLCERVAGPAGG